MTLEEAIRQIESSEFSAYVNVASGFRVFIRALTISEPVTQLRGLSRDPKVINQLLARVHYISRLSTDPRFENPWDTSLAAYLLTLASANLNAARTAAATVASLPRCWWAARLAESVLAGITNAVGSDTTRHEPIKAKPVPMWDIASPRNEPTFLYLSTSQLPAVLSGHLAVDSKAANHLHRIQLGLLPGGRIRETPPAWGDSDGSTSVVIDARGSA